MKKPKAEKQPIQVSLPMKGSKAPSLAKQVATKAQNNPNWLGNTKQ